MKNKQAEPFKGKPFGYYRQMLLDERYKELEEVHAKTNNDYILGKVSDAVYYDVFGTLWFKSDHKSTLIEEKLKKWLDAYPNSAYANSSIGRYYFRRGQFHRGGKWADDTPKSNFNKLYSDLDLAKKYVEKALVLNPKLMRAYDTSIAMSKYGDGDNAIIALEILMEGVKHTKSDFALWDVFMQGIEPRWGGSYVAMEEILKVAKEEKFISKSTYQKMKGYIVTDKANRANASDNYELAIDLVKKNIGTRYNGLYLEIAKAYSSQKNYKDCYDNIKKITNESDYNWNVQKRLGWCSAKLKKWSESREAFTRYIQLTGGNAWSYYNLGKAYGYLDNYSAAYTLLIQAHNLDESYKDKTNGYIKHILNEKPNTEAIELAKLGL